MLYGVVIWGNASLFLLCSYIDHSNRILLDKQVTSNHKKHISMAFRLCVLGCALWQLRAYITSPFVGLFHPRWGLVYPVEGNTCSSRPGHVNVIPWYSIGAVACSTSCNKYVLTSRIKMRRGVFATEMSDMWWYMNTLELYSKLFPNFKVTNAHGRYISPLFILSPDVLRFNKFVIKIIFDKSSIHALNVITHSKHILYFIISSHFKATISSH